MLWILFAAIFAGVGLGTFIGLVVCVNVDWSSYSITEPGKEIIRSIVVGAVIAGAAAGLAALSHNPRVFLALLPVWFITVKLCWLDFELPDLVTVGGCGLAMLFVMSLLAAKLLGGP